MPGSMWASRWGEATSGGLRRLSRTRMKKATTDILALDETPTLGALFRERVPEEAWPGAQSDSA